MRCSDCEQKIKPVVAWDIDGTLGDYHGHFIRFAELYLYNTDFLWSEKNPYTGEERFSDWFCKVFNVDLATFRNIKLAYRQGAQKRTMPAFDYAAWAVSMSRKAGAEVWIATTRPYQRLDNIDPDTQEWLRRNVISYDNIIYDEGKYCQLAERVDPARVVAVVEDLPEKIEEAERYFGWEVPILKRGRYNSGIARAGGEMSLKVIGSEIGQRIKKWKEQNDAA